MVAPVRKPRAPKRPPGATQARVDRVLSSLRQREAASLAEISAYLASHPVVVGPILQYMKAQNLLAETLSGPPRARISVWKLTFDGAKEATFAVHRARASGVRTVFAEGMNPWTGVRSIKTAKK